jgi:flagellar biosynthetic protein FlhB
VLATTDQAALRLVRLGAGAGLLLAFVDIAVVRRRNNKQLKMTKQEVKEEMRSSDGDPLLRGALRSRALAISRNRMMADVPSADVLVVNPTHVAVALRYQANRGAPRVVAKGADHMAARIREVAERNRVPMVQDIPLARTLFASCEVGQEIPADLYQAVATVLAFVMRLRRKGSAAGMHRLQRA